MEKIRLVVIDYHPIITYGIRLALQKHKAIHIDLCASYETGQSALDGIRNELVDVVLVGFFLPDISGIDLISKLLEINTHLKIGIYSDALEKENIEKAFENGAMGFLSKAAGCQELITFISTLATGEMYLRGEIAKIMINFSKPKVMAEKYVRLTARESDVFQMVINGLRTKEIASQLNIADRTVEFHKQNIYQKYGVSDALNLAKMALEVGEKKHYVLGNVRHTEVPIT